MKVVKPQKLGVLSRTFEHGDAVHFAVSVLVFFPFGESSSLLSEVDLWKFAAAELGGEPVDLAMPKLRGEVLVTGSAFPLGGPRVACAPRVAIGAVDKTLYVVGDRFWRRGVATEPVPFTEMPLTWERAFGGDRYPANPVGKGHAPERTPQGEVHPLPNIEDPRRLLKVPSEQATPAGFGAHDFTAPQRLAKMGTYDAAWLKEQFPGFAKDMDWTVWNAAPHDQQIAGGFRGDEPFALDYMHPEKARVEGRLPGVQVRAFVTQKTAAGEAFREIPTRLDTVRLFPHVERGIAIFHGMIDVSEDDGADVVHLVAACEELGRPKPVEHYRDVLSRRLDKKQGARYALHDRDLLPSGEGDARARAAGDDELEAMLATEGLLRKNLRTKAAIVHEDAKRRILAAGGDPSQLPPLPAEEPQTDLDDLPAMVDRVTAQADRAKEDARQKRREEEEKARAACAAQGLDYDQMVRDAEAKAAGPPKFSAEAELGKLKALARQAKAAGLESSEIEAMVSSPDLEKQLFGAEEKLRNAYRRFAHAFPAAARLGPDETTRVRNHVVEAYRAGWSFAECDFTGADLSGLELTRADFKGAFLEAVDFTGSQLGGADLTGAVLARADLRGANLFAAKLRGANLGSAKLNEAEVGGSVDLTGAVLVKADLTGARFHDAQMDRADLSEAIFAGADFSRVKAHQLNFIKTDLSGVKLAGADLTKCNFIESTVAEVDFTGAKLVSAVFVTARGDGAIFRDADLANLRVVKESSFEGADFRGARLDRANLRGTKLARSDFTKASLQGADLSECDLCNATFYRAMAKGAQFLRSNLSGARMTSINLMEGSLQKANIHGADLRGANLFRVDFAKTRADAATNLNDANVKRVRIVPPRRGSNGPQ